MNGTKRVATAFGFSCAVYLTPLVGPHAAFLLGEVIWNDLGGALHGGGDRDFAWIAADVGVALLAQLVLFFSFIWFARRPGWLRGLCVGLSVVPALIVLNYLYMVAIPSRFLIEPDAAAERDTRPLQCAARNVWIPQIASPPTLSGGAPIWVAEVNPPNRYGLFEPTSCAVKWLPIAQSAAGYVTYVAGTHALYMSAPPPTAHQSWFVFDAVSATKVPIGPIGTDQGQFPILSTDGGSMTWLQPVAGATPPIPLEARVRRRVPATSVSWTFRRLAAAGLCSSSSSTPRRRSLSWRAG